MASRTKGETLPPPDPPMDPGAEPASVEVRLLYFAALRDVAGRNEEVRLLPAEVRSISALGPWLEREIPALAGRLGSVRFAINEAFADAGSTIADGDVIALIPPVSGG